MLVSQYLNLQKTLTGEKNEYEYTMTMMRCGYGKDDTFVVRSDVAIALLHFYNTIAIYSDRVYSEGVKSGSNLLLNLGAGKITIEEFNKKIL